MKIVSLIGIFLLGFVSLEAQMPMAKGGRSYAEDRLQKVYEKEQELFEDLVSNPGVHSEGEAERLAEQVARDYEALINDNDQFVEGYIMLGKFLRKIGQAEEANDVFLRANKIDPNIAVVKQQIGNYLAEKEDFGLAMHYYLNAIELDPEVSVYHYCLGELYYQYKEEFVKEDILKEHEFDRQMLTAFEEAVRLQPNDRVLQFRLAEAYYDLYSPNWKKALRLWNELEKSSTDETDRQIIALHKARVLIQLDRVEEGKKALDTVSAKELQFSKGQIEEMLQKPE